MRIGSLMKKNDRGLGAVTASPVAVENSVAFELSVFYRVLNKARDQAWKIGDQAMKKAVSRDSCSINRGCF